MVGRAGRAGKSEIGDSILICSGTDHDKVISLLTSRMDYTVSNFITEPSNFHPMILNLLSNKLVNTFQGIEYFMRFTLAAVQQENYDRDVFACVKDVIQHLHNEGAIEHIFKSKGQCEPFLEFDNDDGKKIEIYPDDELLISRMGQAAVNSGKSLDDAKVLEADLRKANENLVLTQPLHLLYIVAPKEIFTSINLNYRNFSELFFEMEKIDKSIVQTAKIVGISMAQVGRMMTSAPNLSEARANNIKRFYVAMMLFNLWSGEDAFDVAKNYKIDRGIVSKLMISASGESYSIFKFCEVFDEFWVFKEILENFSKRLQHCCSNELLPLMELPGVKIGRAKMLYGAGIKSIMDVAALTPEDLTRMIKFINTQQATRVIRAAKYALKAEFDDNRERLLVMKDVLNKKI
jgi:POLQ-like helicase